MRALALIRSINIDRQVSNGKQQADASPNSQAPEAMTEGVRARSE